MQWFGNDRVKTIHTFSSGHHTCSGFRQDDTTITMCELASGKLVKIRVDCLSPRPHNMTGYALQVPRAPLKAHAATMVGIWCGWIA